LIPVARGALLGWVALTSRKVTAFVSGIDTHVDVASELFTLEPRALDGAGERQ
jgi:hypothetical protein